MKEKSQSFNCKRCSGDLSLVIKNLYGKDKAQPIDLYKCCDCEQKFEVVNISGVFTIIKTIESDDHNYRIPPIRR